MPVLFVWLEMEVTLLMFVNLSLGVPNDRNITGEIGRR
jgi:hypothetical protein